MSGGIGRGTEIMRNSEEFLSRVKMPWDRSIDRLENLRRVVTGRRERDIKMIG